MGQVFGPRHGSMQYWPRKRARRQHTRIRSWQRALKDAQLLGFAGYKVGMTHVIMTDNRKQSTTKNEDIFCPVTVIECPPIKPLSLRFFRKRHNGFNVIGEVLSEHIDKELERALPHIKKHSKKIDDFKEFDDVRLVVYTQPKLTGIGKKKPEIFELGLSGAKEQKLALGQQLLSKEIKISDVFKEGQPSDIHAVTKGKGFQGPVKRFGVSIRSHKSEKTKRGPGSLGAWNAQGHMMYRVAHAGQMGYHTRTEYNKWILKIGEKPEEINVKGGFLRYGVVKNPYILVKGSIPGPSKRLIKLTVPWRADKGIPSEAPALQYISIASKQGK